MLKKQQLYCQLKQDLQRQHWLPETILTQQQLAEHYGVSRIVVRDAVQQLLSDGWLVPQGKAGMKVPGFSALEAQELCLIRLQLEPMALRLAAPKLNFALLGQAEDLLLQANQQSLCSYQRGEINWQFHRLLYESSNQPHLLRLLDQLHQQVARYLGLQEHVQAYGDTNMAEHRELIRLLREHNTDAACLLLTQHISQATALMIQWLTKQKGA